MLSYLPVKPQPFELRGFVGCAAFFWLGIFLATFMLGVLYSGAGLRDYERCRSTLKMVGDALDNYAAQHDGHYPDSLQSLAPRYLARLPTCPSAHRMTLAYESESASAPTASTSEASATAAPKSYTVTCQGWHPRTSDGRTFGFRALALQGPHYSSHENLLERQLFDLEQDESLHLPPGEGDESAVETAHRIAADLRWGRRLAVLWRMEPRARARELVPPPPRLPVLSYRFIRGARAHEGQRQFSRKTTLEIGISGLHRYEESFRRGDDMGFHVDFYGAGILAGSCVFSSDGRPVALEAGSGGTRAQPAPLTITIRSPRENVTATVTLDASGLVWESVTP